MGATSARNYSRHWRAKRLSWNAIGKIRYLFDGAVEYMDPVTLCYPQLKFNELRKALGFNRIRNSPHWWSSRIVFVSFAIERLVR